MGVTDGSNAPPGAVGEVLYARADDYNIPADNVHHVVGGLNLPAGDWAVNADVGYWLNGNLALLHVWIYLGRPQSIDYGAFGPTIDISTYGWEPMPGTSTAMSYGSVSMSTIQINTAVPTQAVLAVQLGYDTVGATGGGGYVIRARRMR